MGARVRTNPGVRISDIEPLMLASLARASMTPPESTAHSHAPVLAGEVVRLLGACLEPRSWVVDCTLGRGGHTEALLATGAEVLALDRDPAALEAVTARLGSHPRLHPVHADFRDLDRLVQRHIGAPVRGLLADLGVSSPQLDEARRGFSFQAAGPLDMRMDPTAGETLDDLLARTEAEELARVLWELGEERRSRPIARAIVRAHRAGALTDTLALAETVADAAGGRRGRIHPATRTFQALRLWVNGELEALDALLDALPAVLAPGGRAAIISFHSLEDRRVKQRFRVLSTGCVCPPRVPVCRCGKVAGFHTVTRGAQKPTDEETARNPRARSARLRVIERLEADDGDA